MDKGRLLLDCGYILLNFLIILRYEERFLQWLAMKLSAVPNLQLSAVLPAHIPSPTLHRPCGQPALPDPPPLSPFLDTRSFLTSYSSTESCPWPCLWNDLQPEIPPFFTSTIIIANHKTSSPDSNGIWPQSLPEWAFRAWPELGRNCLCPNIAPILGRTRIWPQYSRCPNGRLGHELAAWSRSVLYLP